MVSPVDHLFPNNGVPAWWRESNSFYTTRIKTISQKYPPLTSAYPDNSRTIGNFNLNYLTNSLISSTINLPLQQEISHKAKSGQPAQAL